MNFPNPHSPIDPPEVDSITERLSALLDGELDRSELIELEELAVDQDTTIEELSSDLAGARAAIIALGAGPASDSTRSFHIASALDAMDEPEVQSLAAARAQRRSNDRTTDARAQRLNDRLRRLTAAAAVVAVVGGLGVLSLQGGLGGSSSNDESASTTDNSLDAAATLERSAAGGSSDGGSTDGSAISDEAEAMAADDGAAEEAFDNADATDLSSAIPAGPVVVPQAISLADATLLELPDEVREQSSLVPGSAAPINEPICFDAATEVVSADEIVEGITVIQGGNEIELVVLITEELLVFELPQCVRVD